MTKFPEEKYTNTQYKEHLLFENGHDEECDTIVGAQQIPVLRRVGNNTKKRPINTSNS